MYANATSGTGSGAICRNTKRDQHLYYDYGLNLPGSATVLGIEVRLDAKTGATTGSPKLCVQLSWDGGTTWNTGKITPVLGKTELTYTLGNPTDLWGHTWSPAALRAKFLQESQGQIGKVVRAV